MYDKVKNLLINKDISIPNVLFYSMKELEINYEELYYLTYLLNTNKKEFDLELVCKELNEKPKNVIKVINDLSEKKLLKLEIVKNENDPYEKINLKELYDRLIFLIIDKEEKTEEQKINVLEEIQTVFKRDLIAREKQIVNAWKQVGYQDNFVLAGLKEAEYNNELSLAYIDTVLDNWDKQGYKSEEDIKKSRIINPKDVEIEMPSIEIDEGYNWMDE